MITEDYCSYEVAKLLKEKGFDEDTERVYERNIMACRYEDYPMPTHQMAMKWLRDVYDIHISVNKTFLINDIDNKTYLVYVCTKECHTSYNAWSEYHSTYEQAVEAALKYCLTELI